MQKISPFLWFVNDQAEEAMTFYASLFPDSHIVSVEGGEGRPTVVTAELGGMEVTAFDAGPMFKFTEAISFFVKCETQEEVDRYWNALTADGGEESQCGWLKDKWGLSWQIIPNALMEMLGDSDRERANRAMQAMLQMRKIDIAGLRRAYDGP